MKILRPFYLGAGLFVLLALAAWCCQGVLPPSVRGFWDPFEVLEQSRREEQRGRDLDAARQDLWQHLEVKSALVAELAAGRRSLWEAVRVLRHRGSVSPLFLKHLRALYPGVSDDVALCRHMILLTAENLDDQSTQTVAIARLEAELARGPRP